MTRPSSWIFLVVALASCNVPEPPGSHGIVGDASTALDGSTAGACSRAVIVVEEPVSYDSSNVAVLSPRGAVLSDSIASSATASVGLSPPLSGDVVLPTMPVRGTEVVLIDSAKAAGRVLWVDPQTPAHRRELSVATGFYANPHDYVAVSRTKAYVTRFNANPTPGREPFDAGNDVLVVDPTTPSILASIDMMPALGSDAGAALPRADKIVVAGGRAFVLLGALAATFAAKVPSRLAVFDVATDRIGDVLTLDGFEDCIGLALSPSGNELAVLCAGSIQSDSASDLSKSGVVLVDIAGSPKVSKAFHAEAFGGGPVGFFGAYAAPRSLLFQSFGYNATSGASADDLLVQLDLDAGTSSIVLRSAGEAFTLGGVTCDLNCGACFVADAGRQGGVVHRLAVDGAGTLSGDRLIKPETRPGLPARYLGLF
jgi:hypothetical protein